MSKIGRAPITVPAGTTVTVADGVATVTGPKGTLTYTYPREITVTVDGTTVLCTRTSDDKPVRALHGLTRALLANMVKGVTDGYSKTLELVGTGYRARLSGTKLIFSLGFSHEVEIDAPAGIMFKVEGTNIVTITGFSKELVGATAAKIRALKKPEPYKGKGIRYQGEVVRRKAGKAAKGATA